MPKFGKRFDELVAYPIARKPGHLYYIDKEGYVWESPAKYAVKGKEGA